MFAIVDSCWLNTWSLTKTSSCMWLLSIFIGTKRSHGMWLGPIVLRFDTNSWWCCSVLVPKVVRNWYIEYQTLYCVPVLLVHISSPMCHCYYWMKTGLRDIRLCKLQVFVPVVENEHWWCVAFALKDLKIWFIDSMYKNPAAEHSAELKKLVYGLEICSPY